VKEASTWNGSETKKEAGLYNFTHHCAKSVVLRTSIVLHQHAADGVHRVEVHALSHEDIAPSFSLKHLVQPVRPADHTIRPLTSRDHVHGEQPIYEMVNTYNLHLVSSQR